MTDQEKTPPQEQQPTQPPKPRPSIPLEEGRRTGLPPVDQTPSMPQVKPPKEDK